MGAQLSPCHRCRRDDRAPADREPPKDLRRLTRMTRWIGIGIALTTIALTGCSSSDTASQDGPPPASVGQGDGVVRGVLRLVGGPAPGSSTATSGTITLRGSSEYQAQAMGGGHFMVRAEPGTYEVTGTSPAYGSGMYVCRATRPVVVTTGRTTRVAVYCQMR